MYLVAHYSLREHSVSSASTITRPIPAAARNKCHDVQGVAQYKQTHILFEIVEIRIWRPGSRDTGLSSWSYLIKYLVSLKDCSICAPCSYVYSRTNESTVIQPSCLIRPDGLSYGALGIFCTAVVFHAHLVHEMPQQPGWNLRIYT
jgi:hypothetical protein